MLYLCDHLMPTVTLKEALRLPRLVLAAVLLYAGQAVGQLTDELK